MKSTDKGYINKNNQRNNGLQGVSDTHYNQRFFEMECLTCGHIYLANGCDIWLRKCPSCFPKSPSTRKKYKSSTRIISDKLRYQVLKRDFFRCCYCGASPAKDPTVELHIDHIVPWSKGGSTSLDNLQTLCSRCNLGKSDTV